MDDQADRTKQKPVPKFVFRLRRNLQKRDQDWKHRWRKFRRHTLPHYRRVFFRLPRLAILSFLRQFTEVRSGFVELKEHVRSELAPVTTTEEAHRKVPLKGDKYTAAAYNVRPIIHPEHPQVELRRILIVGGMDFLGAALVKRLNTIGLTSITIADDLPDERWSNLPPLTFDEFLPLDELIKMPERSKLLSSFSHIFYLREWDEGESSLLLPRRLIACISGLECKFISLACASSLGAYPHRKELAMGETDFLRPETKAGVMALLFDRYARNKLTSHNYLSLKHYRVFGPNERSNGSLYGLIKRTYEEISERGVVQLPSALKPTSPEGLRLHDFLYVNDAARYIAQLGLGAAEGFREIGSGVSATALDVVNSVFAALNLPPKIDWTDSPYLSPSVQPEKADISWLESAAERVPPLTLDEAVRDYVINYLKTGRLVSESVPDESSVDESGNTRIPSRKRPFTPKLSA